MNEAQKQLILDICKELKRQGKNPHGELRDLLIEMQLEDEQEQVPHIFKGMLE